MQILRQSLRAMSRDRLSHDSEIGVVLGGGLKADGPSVARAKAAAALAHAHPRMVLVLSGSHGLWPGRPERSEATLMREVLVREAVEPERLLVEDESRDTIGNAVFTALRHLWGLRPRPLLIVSSAYHLARSERIFRAVFGESWPVSGVASGALPGDHVRALREPPLVAEATAFFSATRAGDLAGMAAGLRERYPHYADAPRLLAAAAGDVVPTHRGPLLVRPARPDELESVIDILEETARWLTDRGIAQWPPGSFEGRRAPQLAETIRHGEAYLAWHDDRAIATLSLHGADDQMWGDPGGNDAAYVHALAVRRDYAGHGIGGALLAWAQVHARRGEKRVLRLDCAVENAALRAYYERAGFEHRDDVRFRDYGASRYERRL